MKEHDPIPQRAEEAQEEEIRKNTYTGRPAPGRSCLSLILEELLDL